jgi:hypothetical protein
MQKYTTTASDVLRAGKRQNPGYPGTCHILAHSTSDAIAGDAAIAIEYKIMSRVELKKARHSPRLERK